MNGGKICMVLLAVLLCLNGCEQPARSTMYPLGEELGSAAVPEGICRVYCIFAESDAACWTLPDAARATALLIEAADYLEAQCIQQGRELTLKYVVAPDSRYVTRGYYSGDFSGNGEDGMLIAAAAEAWRRAFAPPAAHEQAMYLVLINGQGQSYGLPQLYITEEAMSAETAILYMQEADYRHLAAAAAALFAQEQRAFQGEIFAGQDFSPAFLQYIGAI